LSSQFLSASLPFFTNFLRKLYCMMQWELQPPHWHWGPSDVAVLFYLKQSTHSKLLQASSLPKNGNTQWSHAHAHANAASSEQRATSNEQQRLSAERKVVITLHHVGVLLSCRSSHNICRCISTHFGYTTMLMYGMTLSLHKICWPNESSIFVIPTMGRCAWKDKE
jgi:hypothetical protein